MAPHVEMPRVDDSQAAPATANRYPASSSAPVPYSPPSPYPAPQTQPPYAWMPPTPAPVARYADYRLTLAIVSLALFIPLAAIALGAATAFNATFGAWLGALVVIGAVVVGVNATFNYWLDVRRR